MPHQIAFVEFQVHCPVKRESSSGLPCARLLGFEFPKDKGVLEIHISNFS